MISPYIFAETSPSSAATAASSQAITQVSGGYPPGVAAPLDDSDACDVAADLVGATGGTLDVYMQMSPDGGPNWYDIIHFPQLANGAAAIKYQAPISLFTNLTQPVVVGKNLAPALSSNTIVNGAYGDRLRLLMVAGSGTTVGAAVKVTVMSQRSWNRSNG